MRRQLIHLLLPSDHMTGECVCIRPITQYQPRHLVLLSDSVPVLTSHHYIQLPAIPRTTISCHVSLVSHRQMFSSAIPGNGLIDDTSQRKWECHRRIASTNLKSQMNIGLYLHSYWVTKCPSILDCISWVIPIRLWLQFFWNLPISWFFQNK